MKTVKKTRHVFFLTAGILERSHVVSKGFVSYRQGVYILEILQDDVPVSDCSILEVLEMKASKEPLHMNLFLIACIPWTKGTGSQSDWYVNRYMRKLQNEDRYVYLWIRMVLVTTKAFKLTCVYLCLLDYLRGRRATCANLEYLCLPVLTCGI